MEPSLGIENAVGGAWRFTVVCTDEDLQERAALPDRFGHLPTTETTESRRATMTKLHGRDSE